MHLTLRDRLAFCVGEERAVFLDTKKWRYFALPEELDEVFRQWATGPAESIPISDRNRLVRAGVLVRADSLCRQPVQPHGTVSRALYPHADFQRILCQEPSITVVARVAIQQAWCSWLVSQKRISNFHPVQCSGHGCGVDPPSDRDAAILSKLAIAFERADEIFGNHDRCLIRSLAFTALCRRRDIGVTLVLGVRDLPFAAHAWVQHRHLVVNDTLERVRLFTPILAV